MEYRRLGKSGLRVSRICLGGHETFGELDRMTSKKIVYRAFDAGVNFFDTADIYSEGRSESVLGEILAGLPREAVVIASKVAGRSLPGVNGEGLSRKHVIESCNASLKRLQLEYLDLYQIHEWDYETPIEETLEAFSDLVRWGKVLYTGCSNVTEDQIDLMISSAQNNNWVRPICVQPWYNLIYSQAEQELFPCLRWQGLSAIVFSPLEQGLLTGKYRLGKEMPATGRFARLAEEASQYLTERNLTCVERLVETAMEVPCTPAQLALSWVLRRNEVTSAIVGVTSVAQLDENLGALDLKLDAQVLEQYGGAIKGAFV